jgi:hypothetical protein
MPSPVGRRGKMIDAEDHGTVVGRVGAGLNTITGGDPTAHMLGFYGKQGMPLIGGTLDAKDQGGL